MHQFIMGGGWGRDAKGGLLPEPGGYFGGDAVAAAGDPGQRPGRGRGTVQGRVVVLVAEDAGASCCGRSMNESSIP